MGLYCTNENELVFCKHYLGGLVQTAGERINLPFRMAQLPIPTSNIGSSEPITG
jgi:hypothetical protein